MAGKNSLSELEEEIESLKAIFDSGITSCTSEDSLRNVTYSNNNMQISMFLKGRFQYFQIYCIIYKYIIIIII